MTKAERPNEPSSMEECCARRQAYLQNIDPQKREAIEAFHEKVRAEALRIDPERAEVAFWWADDDDPYQVSGMPVELSLCIGREHFARNPGSDIWIWFDDLPKETAEKLKHRRKPSFTITCDGDAIWNGIDTPI